MIMMMDKKRIVSQIMGDQEGEKETSPLHTVMQEFIQCIETGDAEGLAECFKSALAHCQAAPTEE